MKNRNLLYGRPLPCRHPGLAQAITGPKVDGYPRGATVQFHNNRFANLAGLVQSATDQSRAARVGDNKIVVRSDWEDAKARLHGASEPN